MSSTSRGVPHTSFVREAAAPPLRCACSMFRPRFLATLVSTGNVPFSPIDWKTVHHLSTEGVDNMLGRTHCSCLAISTSSCSPFSGTGGACSSTEIVSKHTTRREFLSVPPARACAGADDKVNAVHPTILSPSFLGAPHLSAALHFPHHVCRIDGCVPRIGWLYMIFALLVIDQHASSCADSSTISSCDAGERSASCKQTVVREPL